MNDSVIKLSVENQIAVVLMEEKEFKNTFTDRLMSCLKNSFDDIHRNPDIKVVVISGYDTYFCCGSPKTSLLHGVKNLLPFTKLYVYDILLRCEHPVIAAMQGHAIGAGLAFGAYADIMVMGEECIYSVNFMKYGFTPDFGATMIIPEKFGRLLGTEMLFRAKTYFGRELRERQAPAVIVKRKDVLSTAMKIAESLADKPAAPLKMMKEYQNRHLRTRLSSTVEDEISMQEQTFRIPEVIHRIENLYGGQS